MATPTRRFQRFRRPFRRKVCAFCEEKGEKIDYKNVAKLRRFLDERGRISKRRASGTCALHQRSLAIAIKRAREMALLPFLEG
jgi:small subunit ribosomal protein S18